MNEIVGNTLQSNNRTEINSSYVGLCYHYLRYSKQTDPFPKIFGTDIDDFQNHLSMLQKEYQIISPNDAMALSYDGINFPEKKTGILITFDDGLSDHFTAAKILSELNISAIFFVPTCILEEKLPANPTIIHYTIAVFGVEKFLEEFRGILENYKLNKKLFDIPYSKSKDNLWETIAKIKSTFKYKLGLYISRKILLDIYKNLFCTQYKNPLDIMHLTENQITKMLEMGHHIGTHTYSHISVAATELNSEEFDKEIILPKKFLEQKFNTKVNSFSYPFGGQEDCLSSHELIKKTNEYKLAFTVEEILNTKDTSAFELGRYQLTRNDTSFKLNNIIKKIIMEK